MKPARAFLQLVASLFLVAALVVSSGFAATKKLDRHRLASEDSSLMNGNVPDTGSSVFSDGGSPALSNGTLEGSSLILSPGTLDNWNGGTGFWSVPGNWSAGEPGASSDVTIYSGGNDTVTLDTSPTISSLVLGGASNGTTSELTDGGVAQTLTITNGLTVGQTGYLQLTGGSAINVGTDLNNAGEVDIQNGSHLAIAGNVNNQNSGGAPPYIYVFTGSVLAVTGNFDNQGSVETGAIGGGSQINVTGTLTNEAGAAVQIFGPGDSASIGKLVNNGFFYIDSGPTQATTVGSLTNGATGFIDLENGSALTVNGDLNNSGTLGAGLNGGTGGNTITINGMLTNSGTFQLNGPVDMATIGSLTNSPGGKVDVENGSTLAVTGDVTNSGFIGTDLNNLGGGNALKISGTLTNEANAFGLVLEGSGDIATMAGLANPGYISLRNENLLQVNGDASNSGTFLTSSGLNRVEIAGNLTNSATFELEGTSDMASIGGNVTNSSGILGLFGSGSTMTVAGNVSNSGDITLDAKSANATIDGALTNSGLLDVEQASTLQVAGSATNSGTLVTNMFGYGGMNTITVTGQLTNSGNFELLGPSDMATLGSLTNSGSGLVDLESGSTLNVVGNVNNSAGNYIYGIVTGFNNTPGNIVNIGGTLTNSGWFLLLGHGDMGTIGNGVFNSGLLDVENASTLQINGDVDNTGTLATNWLAIRGGGDTLNITGTLTNEAGGRVEIYGPGSVVTVSSLTNAGEVDDVYGSSLQTGNVTNSGVFFVNAGSLATMTSLANSIPGFVDVEQGSTLQVNGDVTNAGGFFTNYSDGAFSGGNVVNITGILTNSGTFELNGVGDMATLGSLNNSGTTDVENGSTLLINGDATNSRTLEAGFNGGGGNMLNITGQLTNNGTFEVAGGFGTPSTATIGSVVNNGLIASYGSSVLTVTGNMDNFGTIGTFGAGGATVNIAGTLTNESGIEPPPGQVILFGMTLNAANVVNNGLIDFEEVGTLNVSGDVNNAGMIATGTFGHTFGNTLNIAGTLTNSGLTELDGLGTATIGSLVNGGFGMFSLSGPNFTATIGSVVNSGNANIDLDGTLVTVTGDVNNAGTIQTSGGNTLNITGNLNNNSGGTVSLKGRGDIANVGMLNNLGYVYVGSGATLNLDNPAGIGIVEGGSRFDILGNFNCPSCNGGLGGSGFTNLTLIQGGTVILANGQETGITPQFRPLRIFGELDASLGSTITVQGDVDNHGILATGDPLYYGGGGNTITINGQLNNNSGGSFVLYGPGDKATIGSVENAGLIDLENASSLTVTGDVNNDGNIYTSLFGGSGHNTITIGGELTFSPGGQVALLNPTDRLIISGGGSIELLHGAALSTPTLNNGGAINIDSVSTLLVGLGSFHGPSANYTQLANGTLAEMISSPTSFGVINVSGSALLDGTLAIMLQGGFTPADGSLFKFLIASPGELSGAFSDAPDPGVWKLIYDYADGYVEAEYVPEPATLLVLIPGLLGMGYGLRRKLLG